MTDYSAPPNGIETPPPPTEPTAPLTEPANPKKPVYQQWWVWVIAIVLIGAAVYALGFAGKGGPTVTGDDDSSPAASSEPTTTAPSEPATTAPGEPAPANPSEPAAGTESDARAFAPNITAVIGDTGVIEEIIAQMEVAGYEDYEVEDEDNGEKHYVWTFEDGSKLTVVMVPEGDELAFERVDIED